MNLRKFVWSFVLAVFYLPAAFSALQTPIGNWVTRDEKTDEKRAIITISESGGVLSGVIHKIYPLPGETGLCTQCPGEFKDKQIEGLRFMWGLKHEGENEWNGGTILDPKSGTMYHAKITLQGDTLQVRGYLGVSLLGRTQIWHKG